MFNKITALIRSSLLLALALTLGCYNNVWADSEEHAVDMRPSGTLDIPRVLGKVSADDIAAQTDISDTAALIGPSKLPVSSAPQTKYAEPLSETPLEQSVAPLAISATKALAASTSPRTSVEVSANNIPIASTPQAQIVHDITNIPPVAAPVEAVTAPHVIAKARQNASVEPAAAAISASPISALTPAIQSLSPTTVPSELARPLEASASQLVTETEKADRLLDEIVQDSRRILAMNRTTRPAPTLMEPLRLDEAVAFALSKNPEVLAAASKEDVARWQRRSAYSQFLPAVEINYAQGVERSAPGAYNDANGNRVAKTEHFRRDRIFSVRQPIIDTTILTDIFRSHANMSLVEAEKRDTYSGIVFDTVSTYLKLLRARLAIFLADEYRKQLDDLAQRMTARVQGGGAASVDLDRIKGRYASAEAARLEAVGDYNINLAEFERLTSVVPAQLVLPDRLIPETPDEAAAALERVVQDNPVYRSALSKIDLAAADRNKSFTGALPRLSVEYTKSMTHDAGGSAHGNPIDGLYPNQIDSRFMVVAKWSLNGGTSLAEGMAGVAKVREMKFRAQDVLNRVTQSVTTGYGALQDAKDRASVLQQAYAADTRVVRDFEIQYKSGVRSLFDMLDAYERRYRSQLDLIRVYIDQAQAAYSVRRQLGDIVSAVTIGAGDGRR